MANGWNSGSDREAMLRRVAIVLSSLPGSVASQLMGGIDADSQQDVRRTMASLTDVDPLERKRALHAFKVSVQQPDSPDVYQSSSQTRSDDIAPSVSQHAGNSQTGSRVVPAEQAGFTQLPTNEEATSDSSPLAFLGTVEDESLFHMLATEHPQTVALVLASISPDQAARILPRLDADVQQNALSRIGRLGEIPETAVAEVAAHFRGCLSKQSSSERNALGRRALDAILAAMPDAQPAAGHQGRNMNDEPHNPEWGSHGVAASQGRGRGRLDSERHGETTFQHATAASFPSAERTAEALSARLRSLEPTPEPSRSMPRDSFTVGQGQQPPRVKHQSRPSESRERVPGEPNLRVAPESVTQESQVRAGNGSASTRPAMFQSTDAVHQHLVQLSPQLLCETLGRVETRVAMLALCGLPNQVTDAVLAVLPRAQSKQVRQRMNSLGSLQLREIDQAKEAVAEASLIASKSPVPVAA